MRHLHDDCGECAKLFKWAIRTKDGGVHRCEDCGHFWSWASKIQISGIRRDVPEYFECHNCQRKPIKWNPFQVGQLVQETFELRGAL
jgi:hypothetical protein